MSFWGGCGELDTSSTYMKQQGTIKSHKVLCAGVVPEVSTPDTSSFQHTQDPPHFLGSACVSQKKTPSRSTV